MDRLIDWLIDRYLYIYIHACESIWYNTILLYTILLHTILLYIMLSPYVSVLLVSHCLFCCLNSMFGVGEYLYVPPRRNLPFETREVLDASGSQNGSSAPGNSSMWKPLNDINYSNPWNLGRQLHILRQGVGICWSCAEQSPKGGR